MVVFLASTIGYFEFCLGTRICLLSSVYCLFFLLVVKNFMFGVYRTSQDFWASWYFFSFVKFFVHNKAPLYSKNTIT